MKVLRKFFSEKFRLKKIGIKSSIRFYFFICFLFFPLFVAFSSPSRPKGPNTSCPKSRSALNPNNPTWSPSAKRAKTPTQNPRERLKAFGLERSSLHHPWRPSFRETWIISATSISVSADSEDCRYLLHRSPIQLLSELFLFFNRFVIKLIDFLFCFFRFFHLIFL